MSRLPFITIADTKNMKKALLSVCLGADSTAVAWSKHPEEFAEIQAMVMLQPVSGRYIVEEFVKSIGVDDGYEKFDKAVHERTGFHLSEQSPLEHVGAVTVPHAGCPGARRHHDATARRPGHLRRHPSRREELVLDRVSPLSRKRPCAQPVSASLEVGDGAAVEALVGGVPGGFSGEQQALIWTMWGRGDSIRQMERTLGTVSPQIRRFLSAFGGIPPGPRCRRAGHLTAAEREEISRGVAAGTARWTPKRPPTHVPGARNQPSWRPTRCCASWWWPNWARTGHPSRSRSGYAGSIPMRWRCGSRTRRSIVTCISRHGKSLTPRCFTISVVSARFASHDEHDHGVPMDVAGSAT